MKDLKLLYLAPLFFLILPSCTSHKINQMSLDGDYQGTLPCADCEGIKTNITFEDKSFKKTSIYMGKEPNLFQSSGSWENVNDSTIALTENTEKSFYRIVENKLIALDKEQNRIESALPYSLYKIDYAVEAEGNFSSPMKEGIDLFASGNEPFWSVEIKAGEFIRYNKPDFKEPQLIKDFTLTRIENVIVAKPENHHEIKEIRIYEFPCVNDMSGMVTEQFIELHLQNQILKGCGKILSEKFYLIGNWELSTIKDIDLTKYSGQKATLNFNLAKGEVYGNLGCNGFGGNLVFPAAGLNQIQINRIFSTQMACEDMRIEDNYARLLQEVNHFKIVNNELQLFKADDLLLSFKKTNKELHEK